jgi:predicted HD phosphohydrolase
MDEGKVEDWVVIRESVSHRQSTMPQIIKNLLLRLEEQVDGFAVNQLEHSLQTATRAVHAGANEELIVAALCHDIG